MKPESLRIGNWVKDKDGEHQIDGIDFAYSMDRIEPISLTEEWLEKFGFQKDDTPATFKKYDNHLLSISFSLTNITDMEITKKPEFIINTDKIKYVHQLQNLFFCLVGEELITKEKQLTNNGSKDAKE